MDADSTREDFDHVACPDVHIDDVNQRIIMYYHGRNQQSTQTPDNTNVPQKHSNFVATSQYGLNFNDPDYAGGEAGYGSVTVTYDTVTRDVTLGEDYQRVFEHNGQIYSVSKRAILNRAPDPLDPWTPPSNDPFSECWIWEDTPSDLWWNDNGGKHEYHLY
ncbi:MAG: hypothetical protein V3V05_07735 [Pontiella sp.]